MSPIVMLHGWGMGAAVFAALGEHLDASGDAQALDLPGYGRSIACEPYTLERIAAHVSAVAPPRCCVIGWSLGAQVALAWARAQPEQVEALSLIAATPCFVQREDWTCAMEPATFDEFRTALEQDVASTLVRFCALQARGEDDTRSTARRLRSALAAGGTPSSEVLASGLRILLETDLRADLSAIRQPALILHGACDGLVPSSAADYLARTLPRGTLESIPGAAHAPCVSAPRRVSRLVQEFFDE